MFAVVTLAVTLAGRFGLDSPETCEFRPDFHRGGMAEWSMAVVLKTSPNRLYQDGYIFAGNFTASCAQSGRFCAILLILEPTPITDPPNFTLKLLI